MDLQAGKVYRYHAHPGVTIEVEPAERGVLIRTDHPGFVLQEDGVGPDLRLSLLAMESKTGEPCDRCQRRTRVQRLSIGGGATLDLCKPCWGKEMTWRTEQTHKGTPFDILPWPGED